MPYKCAWVCGPAGMVGPQKEASPSTFLPFIPGCNWGQLFTRKLFTSWRTASGPRAKANKILRKQQQVGVSYFKSFLDGKYQRYLQVLCALTSLLLPVDAVWKAEEPGGGEPKGHGVLLHHSLHSWQWGQILQVPMGS